MPIVGPLLYVLRCRQLRLRCAASPARTNCAGHRRHRDAGRRTVVR